ncbi:MAG TPA: BON domain-containing protein [Gemmatimonadales bacterium]|nr:BON domain-containing protein [Gemmatimonadales bacterium]
MRTDTALRNDIMAELNWDPSIRHEDIAVAVHGGVITLAGTVNTYAQRYAAERAAERVTGVRAIANDLIVKLPGAMVRSDADLAHAAVNALQWDTQVPADQITVMVTDGMVTLDGMVDEYYQRTAAERAIRQLTGLKGVVNQIRLRLVAAPADIKQRIHTSLVRHAALDADQIDVQVRGSCVTLSGIVASVAERRNAEAVVWNARGVTSVVNDITVSPLILTGV